MNIDWSYENVGDVLFLGEVFFSNTGETVIRGYQKPFRTNRSNEAKLRGWCGETNNISFTAIGIAVVTKIHKASERITVRRIPSGSAEETRLLRSVGWGSLAVDKNEDYLELG
jgi:hypothetical protein